MSRQVFCGFLCLSLALTGCSSAETPSPAAPPSDSRTATTDAASDMAPTEESVGLSDQTRELLEDLESIDATLEQIDNEVCLGALEARAEIETLLQQGQDVTDLAIAIDELIAELPGCTLTPAPTR